MMMMMMMMIRINEVNIMTPIRTVVVVKNWLGYVRKVLFFKYIVDRNLVESERFDIFSRKTTHIWLGEKRLFNFSIKQ